MKSKTIVLLIVSILFCTGCGDSFRGGVLDRAKTKGWAEKNRKAAAAHAYQYFLKTTNEGRENSSDILANTDTNVNVPLPKIKYNLLSLDRLVKIIDQWLEDFDTLLGYNDPKEVKYVDTFGLRPSLTQDEKVMKAVRARVKAAELDRQFKSLLGQVPREFMRIDCLNGYNIRSIFGTKSPSETFKFNVDQIDEAKKAGTLKQIESSRFNVSRRFDHKISDPNNPGDSNAFVWVASSQELELTNYKILYSDRPKDNGGNYIEGYRWNNGKRESLPCLKIFMIGTGDGSAVFVIDTKQEGQPGFGVPDFVEERDSSVSVMDLMRDKALIGRLFEVRPEQKRIPPKNPSVYVEIASADKPIDVWEAAPDKAKGWTVPFHYQNPLASNYNVRVEMSKPDLGTSLDTSTDFSLSRTIKYIKKEWTNGDRFEASLGQVVEYYQAKTPYDKMSLVSVRVMASEDTRKLLITRDDGSTETVLVKSGQNKITEDRPIAILYTEGERRYVIKRSNGSKVFDKKRELSLTTPEKTGVYFSEEAEYRSGDMRSGPRPF
ncbi:MAG: hypothetical protein HZA94_03800 [Candidatus Vogelbacteria bacterium]|nr:hypothetical protein [Candidatus Vogelbacteria bacterium]